MYNNKFSEVLKLIYDIRVYSLTAILEEKYIVWAAPCSILKS